MSFMQQVLSRIKSEPLLWGSPSHTTDAKAGVHGAAKSTCSKLVTRKLANDGTRLPKGCSLKLDHVVATGKI